MSGSAYSRFIMPHMLGMHGDLDHDERLWQHRKGNCSNISRVVSICLDFHPTTYTMTTLLSTFVVLLPFALCQHPYYFDEHRPKQQQSYGQQQQQLSYGQQLYQQQQQGVAHERLYTEEEEADYPPQPFSYEYGGADHDGRHFAKTESKDEDGVVKGEIEMLTEILILYSRRVQSRAS